MTGGFVKGEIPGSGLSLRQGDVLAILWHFQVLPVLGSQSLRGKREFGQRSLGKRLNFHFNLLRKNKKRFLFIFVFFVLSREHLENVVTNSLHLYCFSKQEKYKGKFQISVFFCRAKYYYTSLLTTNALALYTAGYGCGSQRPGSQDGSRSPLEAAEHDDHSLRRWQVLGEHVGRATWCLGRQRTSGPVGGDDSDGPAVV